MIRINDQEFSDILVTDETQFQSLLDVLSTQTLIALDTETTGLDSFKGNRIAGISIYIPDTETAYYLPFRHAPSENRTLLLFDSGVSAPNLPLAWLPRLFEALYGKTLETWNGKFDLHMLHADGFDVYKTRLNEGIIALHLLDENRHRKGLNYKLKDVARQFLGEDADRSDRELKQKLMAAGLNKGLLYQFPAGDAAEYAMADAIITHQVIEFLRPYLEKWSLTELWSELNAFTITLWRLENNGMLIDREFCLRAIDQSKDRAEQTLKEIRQRAGYNLNPNSPPQVRSWLGTADATKETLERVAEEDDRAALILQYKFYVKEASSFYRNYLKFADANNKIHTSMNIAGTVTGRLSFSNPNLGQVPRKGKYEVKRAFVAPEGYFLVQADYSQQELRLAAHFSDEHGLINAFNEGIDPHQQTADNLGIPRSKAKSYNFAIIYGAGAEKLAQQTADTEENAKRNLNQFNKLYPNLKRFSYSISDTAKAPRNPDGSWGGNYNFIRLPDGRCRRYTDEGAPFYSAFNSLIQGTGAIIMRRALMQLCQRFPPETDEMIPVQTVYDSFICYVRKDKLDEVCVVIRDIMESPNYNPKMRVEIEYGSNWLELTKWESKQ